MCYIITEYMNGFYVTNFQHIFLTSRRQTLQCRKQSAWKMEEQTCSKVCNRIHCIFRRLMTVILCHQASAQFHYSSFRGSQLEIIL